MALASSKLKKAIGLYPFSFFYAYKKANIQEESGQRVQTESENSSTQAQYPDFVKTFFEKLRNVKQNP